MAKKNKKINAKMLTFFIILCLLFEISENMLDFIGMLGNSEDVCSSGLIAHAAAGAISVIVPAGVLIACRSIFSQKRKENTIEYIYGQICFKFFETFSVPAFLLVNDRLICCSHTAKEMFKINEKEDKNKRNEIIRNHCADKIVHELKAAKTAKLSKEIVVKADEKECRFIIDAVKDTVDGNDFIFFVVNEKPEWSGAGDSDKTADLRSEKMTYGKEKTELLSRVSHEFRTPINIIQGIIAYEKK